MLEYIIGNTKSRRVKNSRLPINIYPSTIFMINKAFDPNRFAITTTQYEVKSRVQQIFKGTLKDISRHIGLIEQMLSITP